VATFDFSQPNGTTLDTLGFSGNATLVNCQSGVAQVTATGGGTLRMVRYENGQGAIQQWQSEIYAFANTARRSMHTQMTNTTITTGGGYEARLAGTNTVELRKNNTYVTEGSISGGNHTTTNYVIAIRSNAGTGQVEIFWAASGTADAITSGTRIVNNTDGSPLSGGYPGFSLASPTNVTDARIDNGTDFESASADPPSITNVDSDNSITATQTNVVITGTDFDTATVDLEQGGNVESQSIDSQDATSIQFDVTQGDVKYGSATIRVTNGDAQDDTQAVTLTAPTGKNFVDLASVETEAENRITATPDLEIGDQIEWSNVQGGTIADVTVNDDGTFECEEAVTAFDVRVWDSGDETWGSIATQDIDDGLTTVPDVVGDDEATGTATLEGDGFVVAVNSEYSASVAEGDIISQSPLAGSEAATGSTVTIVVSLGAAEGAGGCVAVFRRRQRR
jgi:hypothetical protein